MRRSWLAFVPLAAFGWPACGDSYTDEPATTSDGGVPGTGERGGSCYANGTCNAPLTCIDTLCVRVGGDEAGTPTIEADAGDSGLVPVPCPAVLPDLAAGSFQCLKDLCSAPQICCPVDNRANAWQCGTALNCAGDELVECDTNTDCKGEARCCIVLTPRQRDSCPTDTLIRSSCSASCAPKNTHSCEDDGDCEDARKCTTIPVVLGPGTIVLRVCR